MGNAQDKLMVSEYLDEKERKAYEELHVSKRQWLRITSKVSMYKNKWIRHIAGIKGITTTSVMCAAYNSETR